MARCRIADDLSVDLSASLSLERSADLDALLSHRQSTPPKFPLMQRRRIRNGRSGRHNLAFDQGSPQQSKGELMRLLAYCTAPPTGR